MAACSRSVDVPLVAATFANHVFTFGPIYSFGVFLPTIKDHFGIPLDAATAVHSVMISMMFFGSLVAGLLIPRYFRHRTVAGACSIIVLAGYLLASAVEALAPMYAAMAMVGLGLGASNLAGLTALNARTTERRALAVGIAACGTSVGTTVLTPIYSAWLSALGLQWSLRLSGFAAALALGITAPAFWVPDPTGAFAGVGPAAPGKANGIAAGAADARPRRALVPCQDARYLCWWLNMLLSMCGYFSPTTLLAEFAQKEVGASVEATSLMYALIGVGGLATRLGLGCIAALLGGARRVHVISQISVGATMLLLPFCRSTELLVVWSVFYGLAIGPLIACISVVLSELFGTEVLPLYQGVSRMAVGIGSFLGPPAIGFVADRAGYTVALVLAAGLVLSGTVFLGLLAWLQARHLRAELRGSADEPCDVHSPNLVAEEDNQEADHSPSLPAHTGETGEAEEPPACAAKQRSRLGAWGARLCCPSIV